MSIEIKSEEINTVGKLKKWLEVLPEEQKISCDIQLLQGQERDRSNDWDDVDSYGPSA